MKDELAAIWSRLLPFASLHPDQDFFALGGTPELALELFSEIDRATGRDLSPLLIFNAPTFAELASLLELPPTARLAPLIPLKTPGDGPPIYLAHGLGGSVMELFALSRLLPFPAPVYGMQAPGMDSVTDPLSSIPLSSIPLSSIEDLADYFIGAIKLVQPKGPYSLVGYSLGGLIAFEMARRLAAKGDRVAPLVMIDSYPHARRLPLPQQVSFGAQMLGRRAAATLRNPASRKSPHSHRSASFHRALSRVRAASEVARRRYIPGFYNGSIDFLQPATPSNLPRNPRAIWAGLCTEIRITTIPGDHLNMLTKHAGTVAAAIARTLQTGAPS